MKTNTDHLTERSGQAATGREAEREAFEAWFEPDEDNRRSLRHHRDADGNCYSAPYLNGCWQGWAAHVDKTAALLASHAELVKALTRLLTQFPTDSDMAEAGWETSEINEACNAYDAARAALSAAKEV